MEIPELRTDQRVGARPKSGRADPSCLAERVNPIINWSYTNVWEFLPSPAARHARRDGRRGAQNLITERTQIRESHQKIRRDLWRHR
ncbi:hypothetical protein JR316_0005242 [Psilocybe cubensis]|uniref:Uncharacterized protein n=1 Tax=Psilocybe cubensis TaxID=181762 RepID=A0ACB8H7J0_PSICU|nr:hypothetical protein JR316_0005242 [Psilocybe cubensis]KAH9483140.1 hypothetical protein JR316_0005242 [Psilocybe cubensis]